MEECTPILPVSCCRAEGHLFIDQVRFKGIQSLSDPFNAHFGNVQSHFPPPFTLRNATLQIGSPSKWFDTVDGILAIGPTGSTCSPSCTNSIIDDLFSQSSASIASDTYTLCFASDGYLSLGDADASLYDGPIAWIPCSSPNTYQFTITGIEVDGESIGPVGAELFSDS